MLSMNASVYRGAVAVGASLVTPVCTGADVAGTGAGVGGNVNFVSKHRLQHSGNSQSISGVAPLQSVHRSSKMNSDLRLQIDCGIVPVILLSCNKNSLSFSN